MSAIDAIVNELKKVGLGYVFDVFLKNTTIRNWIFWIGKTLARGTASIVNSLSRTLFPLSGSLHEKVNTDLDTVRQNVQSMINDLITGTGGVEEKIQEAFKQFVDGWKKPDGTWQEGLKDKLQSAVDELSDEIKLKVEDAFSNFISNADKQGVKDQVEEAFSKFSSHVAGAITSALIYVLEGNEDYDGLKTEINNALDSLRKDIQLKVQKAFETLITNLDGTGIKDQVEQAFYRNNQQIISAINESLSRFSTEVSSAISQTVNDLKNKVESSVNKVLPELWDTLGLPQGALISTVLYRNVDNVGFEVYVPPRGLTLHYIAIGRRKVI